MLQVKAIVFVQDVNSAAVTDLYNCKGIMMFLPNPEQSAEECIKENIQRTMYKILEDVNMTLKVEPTNDIQYFYEKNMISPIWFDENSEEE